METSLPLENLVLEKLSQVVALLNRSDRKPKRTTMLQSWLLKWRLIELVNRLRRTEKSMKILKKKKELEKT